MTNRNETKAYENVLEKIKSYIKLEQLKAGDRLPSERELAEQLQVSRSTIREGLRAIELLGLIETRQGEGTYLKAYQSYQTLSLLSTFIFQDARVKGEITDVLVSLEEAIIRNGYTYHREAVLDEWSHHSMSKWIELGHEKFFRVILKQIRNELFTKIWALLYGFNCSFDNDYQPPDMVRLMEAFKLKKLEQFFSNE
ncbi:FadR/GntR family transcriptional regulator [Amphibacillus jilinensis]|uniref:FadR/GntR family transcriptional regulator n=1 Tax=Amphibacillus jilinensis TaxID=1216008 RepID=UPI0002ED70B8|nr:GntR family transcriptional regulator [Amphibacillus jilinensis]